MQESADNQKLRLVEMPLKFGTAIKNISDALKILTDKRATLEEKMIRAYFVKLASIDGRINEQIHKALSVSSVKIGNTVLTDLAKIADETSFRADQFLKAARYDLNYLEQYFEYQFYSELESSNLLEDSLKLFASLSAETTLATERMPSHAETE